MKSKLIDILILITTCLVTLSELLYFSELYAVKLEGEKHLFSKYITNTGIIRIGTIELITAIATLMLLIGKLNNWKLNTTKLLVITSLILGIIPWVELWYGSTFYYGEVRDKQGLSFPYLQTLYILYPIWITKNKLTIISTAKLIGSIAIVFLAAILFNMVYEPWKLWQS